LEETNKELEAFTYRVSHDLKVPIKSMNDLSGLMLEHYGESCESELREYMQVMLKTTFEMKQLIEGMLNLSSVVGGEIERSTVDLSTMARKSSKELRQAHPGRKMQFLIEDGLVADGDPTLLDAVLQNLLGNAVKFSRDEDIARIEFGYIDDDEKFAFYIRDNGAGFNKEHAEEIFEVFKRVHSPKEFPGTGIGLATVMRIIHRHGGRIWAESEKGEGATFFFTIP